MHVVVHVCYSRSKSWKLTVSDGLRAKCSVALRLENVLLLFLLLNDNNAGAFLDSLTFSTEGRANSTILSHMYILHHFRSDFDQIKAIQISHTYNSPRS